MRQYKHNFWQARLATNPRVSSPHFICMHAFLLRLVLRDSVRCTAISTGSTTCIFPHYGFNFAYIKRLALRCIFFAYPNTLIRRFCNFAFCTLCKNIWATILLYFHTSTIINTILYSYEIINLFIVNWTIANC